MKLTLSWLKDHLETTASLAEIVEALTRIGLEVEGIEDPAPRYKGFVVARVIEAKPHPNADRLRVCMVDAGGEPVQVVCGAPNARTGMKSVFSPVGTFIPGKNITLAKGVIRGVESQRHAVFGRRIASSPTITTASSICPTTRRSALLTRPTPASTIPSSTSTLTPNRPDATGVAGIARDLAAAGLGTLKTPAPAPVAGAFDCPVAVTLDFSPADARCAPPSRCAWCAASRNGPSPEWMQKRLRAIGLRPISALVDITNYVTFDRGRPLHVFDAAKVDGRAACATRARRRKRARARRQDLRARRGHGRHRRRQRRRIDRRRDGRRAFGLRRERRATC